MSENKIATEVSKEKVIVSNKGLVRADYSFWVGQYLGKFYDNLENNKLIGNKCSECGDVFVPPRKICGKCNISIPIDQNWEDLPETGILTNYTITPYRVNDRTDRKAKDLLLGMIQIDGSSTAIVYRLLDLEPNDVKIGMKVKLVWAEKTKGEPSDIKGFVKM